MKEKKNRERFTERRNIWKKNHIGMSEEAPECISRGILRGISARNPSKIPVEIHGGIFETILGSFFSKESLFRFFFAGTHTAFS